MAKIASIDFLIDVKKISKGLKKIEQEVMFLENHPNKNYANDRLKQIELNLNPIAHKIIDEQIKIIP